MRDYIILVILIMFCYSSSLLSQEVRNGVQINQEFNKMELRAEYELRKYFDRKLDLSHQLEAHVRYNLSDHWSTAASYRYTAKFKTVVSETSENITIDRSRFTVGVSHKTKRFDNDWKISNRLRYQFFHEDNDIFGHTLRYRLKLDHRYNKDFKPYLGSEFFYDLTDMEGEKMRLFLGCEFDINFGSINFYLISENEFENLLSDTQFIIGAGYSVNL